MDPELTALRRVLGYAAGVTVDLPCEPLRHQRQLLEALGARWRVVNVRTTENDRQEQTVRCAFCARGDDGLQQVVFVGPAGEAREAYERHRAEAHPELKPRTNGRTSAKAAAVAVADGGARTTTKQWTHESAIAALQAYAATHGHPPSIAATAGNRSLPSPPTVKGLFGSWAAGVEAAGFPRPTKGTLYGRPPARAAEPRDREAPPTPEVPMVEPEAPAATSEELTLGDAALLAVRGISYALGALQLAVDVLERDLRRQFDSDGRDGGGRKTKFARNPAASEGPRSRHPNHTKGPTT